MHCRDERRNRRDLESGSRWNADPDPALNYVVADFRLTRCKPKQFWERRKMMKRVLAAAATVVTVVTAVAWATSLAERSQKEIVGLAADEVRWFTPPYYNDGRQRAHLFGDSSQDGTWIDRVKIPGSARVLAHTHPQDELVTVIDGTWYL